MNFQCVWYEVEFLSLVIEFEINLTHIRHVKPQERVTCASFTLLKNALF